MANVINENMLALLKGDKGDGLKIKKYYDSVEAMQADYSNSDIAVGDSVAIKDTLALYVKGTSQFDYVGTLKGEKGADGAAGKDGTDGKDGVGLDIKKYYDDVEAMQADYSNPEIAVGDSVAIKDTLALYVKGSAQFDYVGTLKGEKGKTGETGASGADGKDGAAGKDGTTFTPSVDSEGNLSWTNDGDKENPTTVNIKGETGERGFSVHANSTQYSGIPPINVAAIIPASSISSNYPVEVGDLVVGTFYDKSNTKRAGIYVSRVTLNTGDHYDIKFLDMIDLRGLTGADGADGAAGKDGTTFTPSVDAEGNLSWTNDGDKENPPTVNIKGQKGDSGLTAEQIEAFSYLAANMQVVDGKVKFNVEIEAPSFNIVTGE